jgi:hypothetical protein
MQLPERFSQAFSTAVISLTVLLSTQPSPAGAVSLVTGRTQLGADDQLDWSSLGPAQPFNILPNTFTATSTKGAGITVVIPAPSTPGITPPLVFQTALPPAGIPTNFAPGDFVLLTGLTPGAFPSLGNPGPLNITFSTPVFGSGTQIAVDDITSFVATISAYNSQNQLLGKFSQNGTSSLALDNSALFLGVVSETPDISRLEFSTSVSDRAFGIDNLSIKTATVPEPDPSLEYVSAGMIILFLRSRLLKNRKG